jgi:uncharacterized protein (DUF58 family)
VALAVVALDAARTVRPDRLRISRRVPERAGLSQDLERVVRVGAPEGMRLGPRGLAIEVREEFPPSFEVRERTVESRRAASTAVERASAHTGARDPGGVRRAPPVAGDPTGGPDGCVLRDGTIDLVRVYRPLRRGMESLGDLRVRVASPWALVQRQSRLRGTASVAVEPAMLGLKRALRLAASERWKDLGVRIQRRRGGLLEFESLRDYVLGDDPRMVDWKAFAKRGRPIVREFQDERGQELVLLVDCGRRMSVAASEGEATGEGASRGWTKLDHALDAALELAAVALQRGDRVGCLAFDARTRAWIPPSRGRRQLERLKEGVFALEPSAEESDLGRALSELAVLHRRRALVLVLSDVADPLSVEAQRKALAEGARMHRILFAALDDPALRTAAEGKVELEPAVRAASLGLQEERRAGLRRLHGAGARVIDTLPAEAAAPLLAAWLEARRGS